MTGYSERSAPNRNRKWRLGSRQTYSKKNRGLDH